MNPPTIWIRTPERLSKNNLASKKGIYSGIPRQGSAGCLHRSCAGFKPGLDRSTERQFFQLVGKQGKADHFARMEHEKRVKEIGKLKAAADCSSRWAEKNENTKIGYDPAKEHDRSISTRSYIGAKTKKMQSRVKSVRGENGPGDREKGRAVKKISKR